MSNGHFEGVVWLDETTDGRVLGMPTSLRAVLALQSAGAARVWVAGPRASECALRARSDDRVRVPVDALAPEATLDAGLVVAPGVVIDAAAARALVATGPGSRATDDGENLATMLPAGAPDVARATGEVIALGTVRRARTASDRREATRALLRSLRKPHDGWVSRGLNRPVSLTVTRALVWTPIRPNTLSVAILAVGLASAWLAARGHRGALAWAGVLFHLQSVLDGCDGELSRLTFRGSRLGAWLDTIGDDLTNYAFFAASAIGLHRMGLGALPLALGATGVGVGVLASGIEYRYLVRIGSGDLLEYPLGFGNDPEPATRPSLLTRALGCIRPMFKRDFFVFVAMLAAITGPAAMFVMLALFAAGACATLAAVIASELRRAGS